MLRGSPTVGLSNVVRGLEGACDDEAQRCEEVVHERYVHLASMLHQGTACLSNTQGHCCCPQICLHLQFMRDIEPLSFT